MFFNHDLHRIFLVLFSIIGFFRDKQLTNVDTFLLSVNYLLQNPESTEHWLIARVEMEKKILILKIEFAERIEKFQRNLYTKNDIM